MRVLSNPRFAGVYVYGRRRYRRAADGQTKVQQKHDYSDWLACFPNAHPGYISWEQYQQNLKLLEANGRGYELARGSPPREGAALLQGRAVCGQCGRHLRVRYRSTRGKQEAWYVCDRGHGNLGESDCQSIAGSPIDAAIGALIAEKMTPAAVALAIEIRREIEARQQEADQLRSRAVERAQFEADLAQRRFMLVDPGNRLVADTLEAQWNDKMRTLAQAREERERARQQDQFVLNDAIRQRLLVMTADFKKLWNDPTTPNRERKRLLACIIEDATLTKLPAEGITRVHLRFKGGKTETLTTSNPKPSGEQVKTEFRIIQLVDKLLDNHVYAEIADILNRQGLRPGGSARPRRSSSTFTALRVAYLVHRYKVRPRYDRLRDCGMLTAAEAATRLGVHEATVMHWAEHGIITRHAHNAHAYLYELPDSTPVKHCSLWDQLSDRAMAHKREKESKASNRSERGVV
jgi:hypothetical protein